MSYGYPGSGYPPAPNFGPPPPPPGGPMGFDYRGSAGGQFDTSLPLPRQAMLPWTILIPIVGFLLLFLPWITIALSVNRSSEFSRFFKEAGLSSLFIVFLFVVSTIAITVLGIFIARGKRIPGTILLGLSLFPVLVSVLGSFFHQSRLTRIVEGGESSSLGFASALRIGATGYAEIDSLIIIGSLTSACLCFLSAMSTIGSVLTVNGRKLDEASNPDSTKRSPLWLVGTGVGVLLFLIIAGLHLGLGWKWSGGMAPKLGVITFFLAAAAAGPMFGVIRSVVTAVGREKEDALDATGGGKSPIATMADLRRVAGAAILSAVLVAFAVFLFDRATFAFTDRAVLRGLGQDYYDYSYSYSSTAPLLGGTSLLGLAALGIRPASVNLIVDTIAAIVLFAPAVALAFRRPSWVTVGVTGGVAFVIIVAISGWSLSRRSSFSTFAEINERHTSQLPENMVSLKKKNSSYTSYSSYSSKADVNLTVSASGDVKEILSPSYYAEDVGIAPDKNTPLLALVDAAARPRARSSYSSSSSSSSTPANGRSRVRLIGKTADADLPAGLDAYRAFVQPQTSHYDIEMHLVKPKPAGTLPTSADNAQALGGSTWGTPAVSSTSVLWVYATSPDVAKITCMTSREVFANEIHLNDPEAAERSIQKLKEQCSLVTIFAVVPLENAKAEDVFKMVAAMPAQGSSYLSSTPRPVVTADRAAATAWIEKNPVGLRATEPSPWGSSTGLGSLGSWNGSSSSSSSSAGSSVAGTVRNGSTQVNGRLPPEVIQRVVRANNARYRKCYEAGLARDPKLSGKVTVKFVIGRDGLVTSAQDGGSDIGDSAVVSCVVRSFSTLAFPEPEGGIVTVVYPLVFTPAN